MFCMYKNRYALCTYGKIIPCMGMQWHFNFIIFPRSLRDFESFNMNMYVVHVKRKAPLFGCTVCPCWMAGSLTGILGYLIKLWCYFSAVSIKGSLLWAICLGLKNWVIFQIKHFKCCFHKDSLLWLYALAKNNNYGVLYSWMQGHLKIGACLPMHRHMLQYGDDLYAMSTRMAWPLYFSIDFTNDFTAVWQLMLSLYVLANKI